MQSSEEEKGGSSSSDEGKVQLDVRRGVDSLAEDDCERSHKIGKKQMKGDVSSPNANS
jgi:hypothetical protein